jgi:hypothetical protein
MSKALLPMVASLFVCAAAIAALIVTNAKAQPSAAPDRPMMVATAGTPPDRAERRAAQCGEIGARAAGRLAYLEARLELGAAQTPLFERWKQVRLASAKRMQDRCETRQAPAAADSSPVARLARQEVRLKQRMADIAAERPALEALYRRLTDEQKARFDRSEHPMRAAMMMRRRWGGPMGFAPIGGAGMDRMAPFPPDRGQGPDAPPPPPQ